MSLGQTLLMECLFRGKYPHCLLSTSLEVETLAWLADAAKRRTEIPGMCMMYQEVPSKELTVPKSEERLGRDIKFT